MKHIFIFTFLICFYTIHAQDTTWVNSFHFGSKVRDTIVHFPNGNQNQYEKILLYYTMRCKGGLVSNSADRNKGCGEWDYSCNTSIIDSSRVDSLKTMHPDYIISGYNLPFLQYTTIPTYSYTEYKIQKATPLNTASISRFRPNILKGEQILADKDSPKGKIYVLYTKEELVGLTNGKISGLAIQNKNSGILQILRLRIATTDDSNLEAFDLSKVKFTEVAKSDVLFNGSGPTDIYFHTPYNYSGDKSLIIEYTYSGSSNEIANLQISGSHTKEKTALISSGFDQSLALSTTGRGQIKSTAFKNITDQITVGFWAKGDDIQPSNSSIFYAIDKKGNRQLNAHLPWSNGKVYWDCGGDNNGYDRIEKNAQPENYKNQWNHWAFTKNTQTGTMKIYLNGILWFSGTGKSKKLDIDQFYIGATNDNSFPYYGNLDDFSVWNKELTESEIKQLMLLNPDNIISSKDNLLVALDMNNADELTISDRSPFRGIVNFDHKVFLQPFNSSTYFKGFTISDIKPDIEFLTGNASIKVNPTSWRDSIENVPLKITPYSIINRKLTKGTPFYLWEAKSENIYDDEGNITGTYEVPYEDILEINDLTYYNYFPAKYVIMSFVTPYGIGLNLGGAGKTWIFDITDFGPILKSDKRMLMDQGGEYQEEMDLKFAFIKGTPTRNVLDIQPIWPVRQYNYMDILNNNHLEPRVLTREPEVKSTKVRVATTGHGQEGEFISRNHFINLNGGLPEFTWPVWKECANNPVYPQGGTWIYDRAGWCPGAPTDLNEFEIMPFIKDNNKFTIDYGLNTATGDSRYIISAQVVKYGDMNFANDASLENIISPSKQVAYTRENPICSNPVIEVKNNGINPIKQINFQYGIDGKVTNTYTWQGNLESLKKQTIALPDIDVSKFYHGSEFFVEIINVNQSADEYSHNNRLTSAITPVRVLDSGVIVSMQTNGAPNETRWVLKDANGQILKTSKPNLQAFTVYTDTIANLNGCYQLQFIDSDQDGISWWANSDGAGYIRAKGFKGGWLEFQPDFGSEYTFNFIAGNITAVQDQPFDLKPEVFIEPTVTNSNAQITLSNLNGKTIISTFDSRGTLIDTEVLTLFYGQTHQAYIDVSNLASGLYFVKVNNDRFTKTLKLIKI